MARFYANESVALPVVAALRHLGHDDLTSVEAGNAGQRTPDEQVLAFATLNQRAVVTFNRRHFIKLHGRAPGHAGIVICSYDPDFAALARRIDAAVQTAAPIAGTLVRVNRPG